MTDFPERRADKHADLQVTLWDWADDDSAEEPIRFDILTGEPAAPGPVPEALDATGPLQPTAPIEPVVAAAFEVVERSLRDMESASTQPLLEDEPRRYRLRRFGEADFSVYPVVLSGSTFGWTASADATFEILDAYRAAGGNSIDTADSYASGRSEVLIGTWLRERGNRDEVVLSTKIAKFAENAGLSAQNIVKAAEASLRRLQVDHIDVLYFHLDDEAVPLEESLTAAESLVRSGKVRYLGAADYSPERLMEARVIAGQLTLPRFVALQTNYSLVHRSAFERDLSALARAQDLAVVPYSPLGSGFLTGKYRGKKGERGSIAQSRVEAASKHMTKRGFRVLDVLDDVAAQHRVSPTTVALSWLLTKPLVTAPVVSASSAEQVADIVRATRVHLTRAQVAALDRASSYA